MLYNEMTPGSIIMDNFKGQMTEKVNDLLEENQLHVCLLPLNTTDLLQPMDISVNKPVKSFLKDTFSQWYAKQLLQQCEDQSHVPLLDISLEPIDISMVVMKNISAKWFVKVAQCRLGDLHRQLSFCTCYYYYYTYKHTIIMGLFSIIM